ncbi:MAG TPA: hypothetical protein VHP11_07525 [Tepidisphaeraceae bacterium]|nr:hypothetical protein [Tepidisphaeraceae bacterium]
MFGNRLGWGISVVLIIVTVVALGWIYRQGTMPQRPSSIGMAADQWTLQMPIPPRSVVRCMTEPGDAMDLYRRAINAYQNRENRLIEPTLSEVQESLNLIVEARKFAGRGVFANRPQELISYDRDRPELNALDALRKLAFKQGRRYQNDGKTAQAREVYEGMFVLGLKLHEERLVWDEWQIGRDLMAVSRYMAELAETPQEKKVLEDFDAQWATFYRANIEKLQLAIFNPQPWTGDMAALASKCPEPMWRVEATLALGRCKYTGQTLGDQTGARRLVAKLVNDSDASVSLAAKLAKDLSVVDFRKLR